jgi:arylsulfatase A-like enzyme
VWLPSESPTRAALLTGRNHHSVHTGVVMEIGPGYPGYDTVMQQDTATVDPWPSRLGFDAVAKGERD